MPVVRKIFAIAALCVGVTVVAEDESILLQGRALVEVLSDYEAVGYTFIYSTDLVDRRMRLTHEPAEGNLISRLAQSLGHEGLTLEAGYVSPMPQPVGRWSACVWKLVVPRRRPTRMDGSASRLRDSVTCRPGTVATRPRRWASGGTTHPRSAKSRLH